MKKQFLTPAQAETLKFIKKFIDSKNYAPSLSEISAWRGNKGRNSAHYTVKSLIDKGFLKRHPKIIRGLEVI